jgi:hypothetical protein
MQWVRFHYSFTRLNPKEHRVCIASILGFQKGKMAWKRDERWK